MLPTLLILNPRSGRGNNEKHIPVIREFFKAKGIVFDVQVTTCPGDAVRIASEAKKNYAIIVAGGGDGTVNEVVNGIAGSNNVLGILPLGSGNDFANVLSYPKKLHDSLQILTRQHIKSIDLGLIEVINSKLEKTAKYFINAVGIGLDAQVAYEAKKIYWARGLTKYALAAVKVIAQYRAESSFVTSSEFESAGKHLLISIGNGKSSGGGFYLTPDAALDDGHLDVCLAKDLSILNILKIFPFVFVGKHGRFAQIAIKRTKDLVVKTHGDVPVHVDGEMMGLDNREIHVSVIPNGMSVLMPL